MTDENLKSIKEKYERSLSIKADIEKLRTRQNELKNISEEVKEYIDNKKKLNCLDQDGIGDHSDKFLFEEAIGSEQIENSNGIYVYIGTYRHQRSDGMHIDYDQDYLTSYLDSKADYRIYINIEKSFSDGQITILIGECDHFEKEHIILYPPHDMTWHSLYSDVRAMFFKSCVNESQGKAVEKVKQLEKYFKKRL